MLGEGAKVAKHEFFNAGKLRQFPKNGSKSVLVVGGIFVVSLFRASSCGDVFSATRTRARWVKNGTCLEPRFLKRPALQDLGARLSSQAFFEFPAQLRLKTVCAEHFGMCAEPKNVAFRCARSRSGCARWRASGARHSGRVPRLHRSSARSRKSWGHGRAPL